MLIFSIKYLELYDRRIILFLFCILFLIIDMFSLNYLIFLTIDDMFSLNVTESYWLGKNVYHSSVPNTLNSDTVC